MKITYLHQYFNTPSMQGGTRSYEMARRLVDWGHEVNMITAWREADDRRSWFVTNEDGIRVHWLPVEYRNEMSYAKRVQAFLRFAIGAARRAAKISSDIVFATSTPLTIALPGAYAARRQRCPMVFEVRDLWPEMPIAIGALQSPILIQAARWLERFAYRNSEHVVALSPGMADGVAATGFDRAKITVVPNGCDFDLFQSKTDSANRFLEDHPELKNGAIVLYAGTLGRVNGVDYMVRLAAACGAMDSSILFVVVGSGSELPDVLALSRRLGVLGNNFFIYPQVPKSEIAGAYAASSVVASWFIDLPAMEKNSANKFFDGLAAGRPICLNYAGWQADLLEQHGAGFVLPRDVEAASGQLLNRMRNNAYLQTAGRAAMGLAKSEFARDLLAKRLENALLVAASQ